MFDKQIDDLTRIKGIGASGKKWFNEALGVSSFEQLASLSPISLSLVSKRRDGLYPEVLSKEERQLDDICRGRFSCGDTPCKVEIELENPSVLPGFYHILTVVTISGKSGRGVGYLESSQFQVL